MSAVPIKIMFWVWCASGVGHYLYALITSRNYSKAFEHSYYQGIVLITLGIVLKFTRDY